MPTSPVLTSANSRSRPRGHFDLLPPELVHEIFDYLVPLTVLSSLYKQRQSVFRQLCLVSKYFAFLLQVVKLTPSQVGSALKALMRNEAEDGNKVKVLILDNLELKHRDALTTVETASTSSRNSL
jgi:hypothetical protein